MTGFFAHLWQTRSRPPIGSRDWIVTWAKRVLLASHLLKQLRIQAILRRRGAAIGNAVHISSISQFGGSFKKLSIGDSCIVGRVEIALHDTVRIGHRVCINDGARLLTGSHDVKSTDWKMITAPVVIEDYAWVAIGAIVLPGVTIGRGAVVGAAAVVSKDVPAGSTVVGNPARVVSTSRPPDLKYSPVSQIALFNAWRSDKITQ